MRTAAKLDGSIIQIALSEHWKQKDWEEELGYMAAVGMDHLILQWTLDSSSRDPHAFYPTLIPDIRQRVNDWRCIDFPLREAASRHMMIWIGLVWNDQWFKHYANNPEWLQHQFELATKTADEIRSHMVQAHLSASFGGFSMPLEMDNVHFVNQTQQDLMAGHYRTLADHIHQNGMKLMVAPFFNEKYGGGAQGPAEYAAMWERILKIAPLDVIALQDGIGTGGPPDPRHCTVETIGDWLAPLSNAIRNTRPTTELWADVELYDEVINDRRFPASLDRVRKQLAAEAAYVSKMTSFSFNHFMSPKQFFGEYKEYVDEL